MKPSKPCNVLEYEKLASKKIKKINWDYISGGAGDESGLQRCRTDLNSVQLVNRVLRNVENLDTSIALLGKKIAFPILAAPSSYHGLIHPKGEVETAKGVEAFGTPMVLSTVSSKDMEEIAKHSKVDLWFQLYLYRDKKITELLMKRAEASGCRAIVLTVDLPVVGVRYREIAHHFKYPQDSSLARFLRKENLFDKKTPMEVFFDTQRNSALTWKDLEWLQKQTKLPIFLKGILSPEDAKLAVKQGVAGIIVSDHGARQLDALVSPVRALPKIREAVGKSATILVDGGIRTGSDVARCLCLGANAVLLGRPILWGLAVDGKNGVTHVLSTIGQELKKAMAILGTSSVSEMNTDYVMTNQW